MKTLLLMFIVYYSVSMTEITGKIVDKNTSEELVGVMIILNKKDTTYSDLDGNFYFKEVNKIESIDLNYPSYSDDNLTLIQTNEFLVKK